MTGQRHWSQVAELTLFTMYDFEKAFDKVPHMQLWSKLKSYKIHTSIIEWIKTSYQTANRE